MRTLNPGSSLGSVIHNTPRANMSLLLRFPLVVLLFVVFHAGGAAKSGAQQDWQAIVEGAKKEGKIVIMGPPGANSRNALTRGFRKAYGIKVVYEGAFGSRHAAKLHAERGGRKYRVDIHVGGPTTPTVDFLPTGVIDPIHAYLVGPESSDFSQWMGGKAAFVDETERYILVFTTKVNQPLAYNPRKTSLKKIRSWRDFLDPRWKGKIVMHDPRISGPGAGVAASWYTAENLGEKFIRQMLIQQKVTFSRRSRQVLEWIVQGRFPVAIAPSDLRATEMQRQGLPIKLRGSDTLKEGGWLTSAFGNVMVINRAPHPNAVKIYLNWLLSREGQTAWVKGTSYVSRRLDVTREGLVGVPQEGVKYVERYHEKYQRISGKIRSLTRTILQRR